MSPAALDTARAQYRERAESVRLRLVSSAEALRDAMTEWDDETGPQRAVLVVEDEPGLARLIAMHLEGELRIEGHVCHSYDAAARLVGALPWAAVVLDLDLRDPEGRTGIALLRLIPRTVPVVICTGRLEEPALKRLAERARCSWYVKAAAAVDLADVVRAAMAAHGDS